MVVAQAQAASASSASSTSVLAQPSPASSMACRARRALARAACAAVLACVRVSASSSGVKWKPARASSSMIFLGSRAPTARGACEASHHACGSPSTRRARPEMNWSPSFPSPAWSRRRRLWRTRSWTWSDSVRSPCSRKVARASRSFAGRPGAIARGLDPHLVVPSLYRRRYSVAPVRSRPALRTSTARISAGRIGAPARCACAHACSSGSSCPSNVWYSLASAGVSLALIR